MSAGWSLEQKEMEEGRMKRLPYRMLFLLHLLLRAILEGPLDNVGLVRDTLEVMALFKLCPEVVEVLEFDEVPDLGKRGGDDGRLGD